MICYLVYLSRAFAIDTDKQEVTVSGCIPPSATYIAGQSAETIREIMIILDCDFQYNLPFELSGMSYRQAMAILAECRLPE